MVDWHGGFMTEPELFRNCVLLLPSMSHKGGIWLTMPVMWYCNTVLWITFWAICTVLCSKYIVRTTWQCQNMPVSNYLFSLNDSVSRQCRLWFHMTVDERESPYNSGHNCLLLLPSLTPQCPSSEGEERQKLSISVLIFLPHQLMLGSVGCCSQHKAIVGPVWLEVKKC